VPDAGRYALHKLAVAERRGQGPASIKAQKDRRQAAVLIEVLTEAQPGTLATAARAALDHRDRGLVKDIKRSLSQLPDKTRYPIRALLA
jgi:hypothetical protein